MAHVKLTPHLQRFFPELGECDVGAKTVRELVVELDRRHPGLASYIVDETGRLRRHVNVFVGEEPIRDREQLSDPIGPEDRVFILQALSGG